jgi:hypothetical protein
MLDADNNRIVLDELALPHAAHQTVDEVQAAQQEMEEQGSDAEESLDPSLLWQQRFTILAQAYRRLAIEHEESLKRVNSLDEECRKLRNQLLVEQQVSTLLIAQPDTVHQARSGLKLTTQEILAMSEAQRLLDESRVAEMNEELNWLREQLDSKSP